MSNPWYKFTHMKNVIDVADDLTYEQKGIKRALNIEKPI